MPPDRADELHPLTIALRNVIRKANDRKNKNSHVRRHNQDQKVTPERLENNLRYAIRDLMQAAYDHAVGSRATGEGSSKSSVLRRCVLGHRRIPSARANAAPAGTLGLGLDEVGIPPLLARALLNKNNSTTDAELVELLQQRWFWLKRDPVLHRWGLLPVRCRLAEGDVIRLPASLLGPLGADFDGDTVALFASVPGQPEDISKYRPSTLAWDVTMERPMFLPGKQYRYGLNRLMADAARRERFLQALKQTHAPAWNDTLPPIKALDDWIQRASGPNADGRWWSIIEEHAIEALAEDPSMGLGLLSAEQLAQLPVLACGAAKKDIFD